MDDTRVLQAESKLRGKKRKKERIDDEAFQPLEIDINAPEPASKKELRRAKRLKATPAENEDTVEAIDLTESKKPDAFKTKESPGRSPHGIWIGNLAFFVTKKDLQAFFTGDADHVIISDEITRIHLPQGAPKPGSQFQNKGFAYVDLTSAAAVEKALYLSEKLVGGRRVLIKNSKDFKGRPESTFKSSSAGNPPTKRIFVGNLGFDVSKEDLEHHFEICGSIHDVHMATFEDSGKCKGYAWVEFEQLASAESAMRGWVDISDSSAISEKEDNDVDLKETKKIKKRVWVNKMADRKLRMEFAEDKATRYKKRYGKESRSDKVENSALEDAYHLASGDKNEATELVNETLGSAERSSEKRQEAKASLYIRAGHSVSSIRKMTGAIIQGQGTKVTFD